MQVLTRRDHLPRQFRWKEVVISTLARDHRALTGMVDPHRHRTGKVGIGMNEVRSEFLGAEVFLGQLSKTIPPDLTDKHRLKATTPRPHRDVGSASAGSEHDLSEGITARQKFGVGPDQHVPSEIAKHQ